MPDASPPSKDTQRFWDMRYADEAFAFGERPNAFLAAQAAQLKPGMRALAPGDGQGRNGVWLAGQGLEVETVDISPVGVAKARALAESRGVGLVAHLADLTEWDWPEAAFDVVAAIYLHFFDAERPAMHGAMLSALKPGGLLVLEAFSLRQLEFQKTEHSGGPKTADMLYSEEKLRSDFAGAQIMHLEEAILSLDEGHRHKGRAAAMRLLARRPDV